MTQLSDRPRTAPRTEGASLLSSMLLTELADATPEWVLRGACGAEDVSVDLVDPRTSDSPAALALCSSCPVRAECAAEADRKSVTIGLWAGHVRKAR